jgi:hypothetical protein
VAHRLDIVAVGIEHEGAAIVRVIVRTQPGAPLSVLPAANAGRRAPPRLLWHRFFTGHEASDGAIAGAFDAVMVRRME